MIVYVILQRITVKIEKPNGEYEEVTYNILEAIWQDERDAHKYITLQPPKIKANLFIECWSVQ